jgi:atypical dual specificity phosphatase
MADLDDEQAAPILDLVRRQCEQRAVLLVTHHLRRARTVSDRVALMVRGRIIEEGRAADFFERPHTEALRTFLRTGSCDVLPLEPDASGDDRGVVEDAAAPSGDPELDVEWVGADEIAGWSEALEEVEDPAPPEPVVADVLEPRDSFESARRGPTGFRWVVGGRLGGSPRPGGLRDIEDDLEALCRVGTDCLITLTETEVDSEAVRRYGLRHLSFPIVDMEPPSISRAVAMCARVQDYLRRDETVVFHCRAGIGRTGTMLAAMLVWNGVGATEALARVRRCESSYVQSREQEEFLTDFANSLHRQASHPRRTDMPTASRPSSPLSGG